VDDGVDDPEDDGVDVAVDDGVETENGSKPGDGADEDRPAGGVGVAGPVAEVPLVTGMPVNSPAVPGVSAVTFWTSAGIGGYTATICRVVPGAKPSPLVEATGL
jgi:hypothetical protein